MSEEENLEKENYYNLVKLELDNNENSVLDELEESNIIAHIVSVYNDLILKSYWKSKSVSDVLYLAKRVKSAKLVN